MSLFSFLRKNKQESSSDNSTFYSRAEEDSKAVRNRTKRKKSAQDNKIDGPGGASVDPVLPEKKRARRRLIGAVALVLAAVIGLPMILDSEPKPLADDIAIQIPSKEKSAAPSTAHAAESSPKIAAAAALDPAEEVIEQSSVAADTKTTLKDSQRTPPAAATATVPDAPASGKTKETSKSNAELAKLTEKPRTPNQSSPAPAAKVESKGDSKTTVQNLSSPKAEVKAESKQIEKPDDAARAKALLEGKPDPKVAEKKSGKFVIQVAALATKEKVNELQTKLKDAGIKSYTQKVATETGDRTRIRVGPFGSKEEAEKIRAKIVKIGLNGSVVPT
jgi:DedD protein